MSKVINAFSNEYVKTYMPEFVSNIRKESGQKLNGEMYGAKSRATRANIADQNKSSINLFPKTRKVSLEPTTFHIYSKAGVK